jgi:quinohemoprotein ethanol dehydrogenase
VKLWSRIGCCGLVLGAAVAAAAAEPKAGAVDPPTAANPAPGEWPLHGRTFGEQRFSPLTGVNTGNVSGLGLAWSYATQTTRGLEATPIVTGGVMIATGSWSVVFALDAATGVELWRYDPQVPKAKGRDACCDVVNRGVAVWRGRVYVGTIDGRLIALDAATGKPQWQVQTTDPRLPYTITGAPRVLKGLVLIGNGGAEFGVRGYVTAYDARTGEQRWRFYTVPASADGPHEHPELEQAAKTWSLASLFESGLGGTVWDSMAYDPQLDLLYVGVGNSSVYNREQRSPGGGDNLFLASVLALKPDTGQLVWHYQTTPGEQWDYTATQHMVLADLEIGGATRQVLMQAPKNGFFYVLDRRTGELISAEPYVHVSWATHVDRDTGRPVERSEATWSERRAFVAPAVVGGHNWHPMSFSPETGLVYIPAIESAYLYVPDHGFRFEPGRFNTAEDLGAVAAQIEGLEELARATCSPTRLIAWDPVAQKRVWEAKHDTGVPGGVLSTAGQLVFQGNGTGAFSAYDARTGERLWSSPVGIGIMAPPVSYEIAGEQYVAVLAGVGGSQGGHFTVFDYVNAGRVLAWKLGGSAKLPPVARRPAGVVAAKPIETSPEQLTKGRALYAEHCMRCHGMGAKSSGLYPDLRHATAAVHEGWDDIVLGGVRGGAGMASFADVIDAQESADIHAYVVTRALYEPSALERLGGWFAERGACVPVEWTTD